MIRFQRVELFGNAAQKGGRFHLKLNIGERPIANKYREGKMKRTLKRELKVREIVERETFEPSHVVGKSVFGCEELHWLQTARLSIVSSLQSGMHFFNCRSTSVCFAG